MHTRTLSTTALMLLLALSGTATSAQSLDSQPTWYLQAAQGDSSSTALVLGTTLPWKQEAWRLGSGDVRGHWDMWLGAWSNRPMQQPRFQTAALGIGPSLRWRGAQGTSPWFAEVGTALMVTGKTLSHDDQRMGTRWNFASHLGMGMNFGPQRAHELSLRIQHASNAGLKKPNPGLNFVQIRYAQTY